MDDVIEQLAAAWIEYLNDRYGTETTLADARDWDISLAFPTLTKEQVFAAERDDAIWDRCLPMPGAVDALRRLMEDGHDVYIVTATIYHSLRAKMEKVLFRYFPYINWDHVIITSHKQMIKGDVLIDDAPHNLAGGDYHKILFEAGHNLNFDAASIGAVRVRTWDEAYAEICRLDASR